MFQRKINAEKLTERLNADFYGPVYIANQRKLDSMGCVPLSRYYKSTGIGHTAAVEPHYARNGEESVPFVAGKSIKDGALDSSSCERIKLASHIDDMRKSMLTSGDLLTIRKGDPGNSGVVPQDESECNCSSEIIFFKGIAQQDAYFLFSFLNSHHGRLAFRRLQRGTMIPGVSLLDVPGFGVPRVEDKARRFIGGKVRQAERLRSSAKMAQRSSARALPDYFSELGCVSGLSFRVFGGAMRTARLDSHFYRPHFQVLDAKLAETGCMPLGALCSLVETGWDRSAAEFLYYEIGSVDVVTGTIIPERTLTADAPSRAKTRIQFCDVLISTVRPNRRNVAFVMDNYSTLPMVATSGFSVLRFKSAAHAAFYHAWLRTEDATAQLMRWNSGSAYPAIDSDVPLQILVPAFDAVFVAEWGAKLLDAQVCLRFAKCQTTAAKLLVEALIEGQITAAQLTDAQQALEAGDDSLDRAILARLTTDGLDGAGDPLFPDLDQLYDLLERAQPEVEA